MSIKIGTATDNENLLDQIIRFVCGYGEAGVVGFTGTGNGVLTLGGVYPSAGTYPATVSETWTVTCTAAAANGGTFSVTGSVSGAQAAATVGVAYTNGKVGFTIADGSVDFTVGAEFTFTTTQGAMKAAGSEWLYQGRASDQTTGGWVKGRGLAGTDSIYVGMRVANDVGNDIYNIELGGAVGFSAATAWSVQIGKSPVTYMAAWNTTMPFWLVANGQRFVAVAKVSTTYHAMHAGKILPYGMPSQYGYPLMIGGENSALIRWSNADIGNRHFVDPGTSSQYSSDTNAGTLFLMPDGSWVRFCNFGVNNSNETPSVVGRTIWPYSGDNSASASVSNRQRELRDNIDGSYTVLPLILHSDAPSRQVLGEIDGCYFVSGFNNAAENIVTIGGTDHLVVQNIFRTNRWNYWALKLA